MNRRRLDEQSECPFALDFSTLRKGFYESNFAVGSAADANDFLVYRDGTLFYDIDGSGQREAVALVELTGMPSLSASRILLV